jgi:hypothetical protein
MRAGSKPEQRAGIAESRKREIAERQNRGDSAAGRPRVQAGPRGGHRGGESDEQG